jgi:uncharacterized protein (DUF1501 family)
MALSRRQILRAGVMGGLAAVSSGWLERAAATMHLRLLRPVVGTADDTVLVVVTLEGGNDGLSSVVPLRQYDRYYTLRPTIAVARERLLPLAGLEEDLAFNPGLAGFARLFAEGRLAVIPGVGWPPEAQGFFDHSASLQNLMTATIDGSAPSAPPTGWLGRFLDGVTPGSLPPGISRSRSSLLLSGRRSSPLGLSSLSGLGVSPTNDAAARREAYRRLQQGPTVGGVAQHHRLLRQQMLSLGGDLEELGAAYAVAPGVQYPVSELGAALRDCAALIAARRGVRALEVAQVGFDTHVDQQIGPPRSRRYHERLLSIVGDAVAAFQADLDGHGVGARVLTLVYSEFGRRPLENSDRGTDHGLAGLMFVIGDAVHGGVWSDYPDLRDEYLVRSGNLDSTVDFRSAYATILARHFDVDPGPILGGDFELLGFL